MIDWTKKIEAYYVGGTVAPATVLDAANGKVHCDAMPMDGVWWFDTSGKTQVAGWRIRNVAEPKDDVPAWAVKRARAIGRADLPDSQVVNLGEVVMNFARYIAAHEQQPVDPDLIEARKIAIDNLQGVGEDVKSTYTRGIQSGEYDAENRVGVKLALAAIKRGRELERGEGK